MPRLTITHPTSPATTTITPAVLLVLGLLSAIAPFATDLYLPAFPQMTVDLSASATSVQLTLTAFLVGVTIGQLVLGPLSDRLGRIAPLVAGGALCVAASTVAATAPTVEVLVVARLLQGLGGAAGMVIGRAVITDLATGRAAARAFSLMMMVGGVAPVIAPVIGGLLVQPLGWRGLLGIVLALSAVMLAAVVLLLRETHPRDRRIAARARRGTSRALRSRSFISYAVAFGFAFAAMMAYISASPFVYQDMIGMGELAYGVAFGVNAAGLIVSSAISARLAQKVEPARLVRTGVSVLVGASLALMALAVTAAPAWTLAVPLFFAVVSLGPVLGNATALALSAARHATGSASAVIGALQFGLAAAVSPLVSLGGTSTAVPLAIVMSIAAVIALAGSLTAPRVAHA